MATVTVYGAPYSTYTRSALLALQEKGVPYSLSMVDIFQPIPPEHVARQPWGKIPVLEHDGFLVYETPAVLRYIAEAFPGEPLQPASPRDRARMMQVNGIIDSYGYKPMIPELFVQRVAMPRFGTPADEAIIAAALPLVERTLDAIVAVQAGDVWLAGEFSLADLHLAPVYIYVAMAPEGQAMLAARPSLAAWWARMSQRPSVAATRSPLEG
jgi:glutathione S-transferase